MSSMFETALINGIPILFVVMGLVSWVKKAGLDGVQLQISSLVIGLLLGVGYLYSTTPPVDFASWFGYAVYGLALGLTASGVVDAVRPQK